MSKLKSINVKFAANDKIELDVRFEGVDIELEQKGFILAASILTKLNSNYTFKLVKKADHILLQSNKTDPTLKGCNSIKSNRGSGYKWYFPYGTTTLQNRVIEKYGKNFSAKMNGDDIELHPVFIEEIKNLRQEILTAIMRYDQKNN